jgi:hypothetical protein
LVLRYNHTILENSFHQASAPYVLHCCGWCNQNSSLQAGSSAASAATVGIDVGAAAT